MKTSGSKRSHYTSLRYSYTRNERIDLEYDELPKIEGMGNSRRFYNGKINYGLLVRFLEGQIGNNWETVYSEILSRIPTKLLDYKEMIYWFVADQVEIIDNRIWNKRTQLFLSNNGLEKNTEFKKYWVDPESNIMKRYSDNIKE